MDPRNDDALDLSPEDLVKRASSVVAVLLDNQELAGLVGKTIADFLFRRHAFTAEQTAQLNAHFDDLVARVTRLDSEIDRTP